MDKKNLGERIKLARKQAGFTQEELAQKLDIAYPTLNKYEKGHRAPDAILLSRMAILLECDPGWLLVGDAIPGKSGISGRGVISLPEKRLINFFRLIDKEGRSGVVGLIGTYVSALKDSELKSAAEDLRASFEKAGGQVTAALENNLVLLFRSLPEEGKMGLVGMLGSYVSAIKDNEAQSAYNEFNDAFMKEVKG